MTLAGVAKLVDARGLGPRGAILGGSSPLPGTNDPYPIKWTHHRFLLLELAINKRI